MSSVIGSARRLDGAVADRLLLHDAIAAADEHDGARQLLVGDRLLDERRNRVEPRQVESSGWSRATLGCRTGREKTGQNQRNRRRAKEKAHHPVDYTFWVPSAFSIRAQTYERETQRHRVHRDAQSVILAAFWHPPAAALRAGGRSGSSTSVRLRDLCGSVFLFVFLLLVSTAASAQGRVTGVVKDGDGHPIKGATITAENPNFATVTVTSDAKGRYGFLGLRGGAWTFVANAPGFREARRQSTTRAMGANMPVDFELDVATELTPAGPLADLDTRALQQQLGAAADLEKAGKLDEAVAAYRDVLSRVPSLTSVHLQLGVLFERKGDSAAALTEYQAALKADPGSAKARAALDRLARK